jgi:ankyrin repeat protein
VEILKLLLRAKAEVDQTSINGVTPLMVAAEKGHLACIDLLLAGGANVHHKSNDGRTALDYATDFKHTAVEAVLRAHIAKQEAEAEAAGK